MKPTIPITRQHGGALQVLLISTALITSGLVWGGFVIAKSLRPVGTLPDLRADLIDELKLATSTEIQVKAPPLLFTLARWALHVVDVEPEVRDAVRAVRDAQVGVCELTETPDRRTRLDLIRITDERLGRESWERVVCVLDGNESVLVYLSSQDNANDQLECCVIVLGGRELVLLGARLEPDAIGDLIELAAGKVERQLAQFKEPPSAGRSAIEPVWSRFR